MGGTARVLSRAPEELTGGKLRRLGEGIGTVVYASEHWVVRRERAAADVLALIVIWKALRRVARWLPGGLGARLLQRPSRWIRLLRVTIRPLVAVIPRSLWLMTHAGQMWRLYLSRDARGRRLAEQRLAGTALIPERISFPAVRLRVGGWPGWLTVSEATERVEETLDARLRRLAGEGRFDEVERWLERLLELRQSGWRRGLFSTDAHLKNFGVAGDRVVLLDSGGLTDRWDEIETRLAPAASPAAPHVMLGLETVLDGRPDIARRFNERWNQVVSRSGVLRHWPGGAG